MAGGQWRIVLPPSFQTQTIAAGTLAGAGYPIAPTPLGYAPNNTNQPSYTNILGYDRPTIMTEWELESIYLPVWVRAGVLAAFAAAPLISVALELVLNGQVVWASKQTNQSISDGLSGYQTDLTFAADLFNAITLNRGSRLSLRGNVFFNLPGAAFVSIDSGFAVRGAPAVGMPTPSEGSIGYTVKQLQGARQL